MQTLGVSDATPRSEGRWKSLFWPSVDNATDVDDLGTQGYWICSIGAVFSCVASVLMDKPVMGLIVFACYFLGGVGVREHSFSAAVLVFLMFLADLFFSPFSIVRIVLTAVLLSKVRATWIASRWNPESEEAASPPRLDATFTDKFADQLPMWPWPKLRIVYLIFATGLLALTAAGLILLRLRGH